MNTIDWNKIKTGVGFAGHIPEAIRRLSSPLDSERKHAYYQIDNHAIIQSDLYEAAYYIIDPILEELEKLYVVNRYYSFLVLSEIVKDSLLNLK